MEMIFATGNKDKVREFGEILGEGVTVRTMKEAGVNIDIAEDGETFEENALIKARTVAKAIDYKAAVVSDDSGLEVDFLGGKPGVYSARWMGEDTGYDVKNAELIRLLSEAKDDERGARYVCAIAVVLPDGSEYCVRGTMEGEIAKASAGEGGFGYDPVFYVPSIGLTAGEMTSEQKHQISHRGNACRLMKEKLEGKI